MEIGQTLTGTVEKCVFGGSGLIRHAGWVIFVPDVAVGEEVEVVLVEKKKSYFLGALVQVVKTSLLRHNPPCPYFGSCGGCQLQHLQYAEHLRLKVEWLQDAFERIAKQSLPEKILCVPATSQFGYRRKIILHVRDGRLGYFSRDNRTVLEIASCPLFSAHPACFDEIREVIRWFEGEAINAEVAVLRTSVDKVSVRFSFAEELPVNAEAVYAKAKASFAHWEYLWFENPKSATDTNDVTEIVEGMTIFSSPRVFIQNYPEQSMRIYRDVLSLLQDDEASGFVLDLYSGIGILSLMMAKSGRKVLGVELQAESVRLAKKSAAFNGLDSVEFRSAFAEDVGRIKGLSRYKTWIINPPRTGLSPKVVQTALKMKPKRLIYISCMPPTMARDIKMLCEGGYEIENVSVYDMFPQTTHLETVIALREADAPV